MKTVTDTLNQPATKAATSYDRKTGQVTVIEPRPTVPPTVEEHRTGIVIDKKSSGIRIEGDDDQFLTLSVPTQYLSESLVMHVEEAVGPFADHVLNTIQKLSALNAIHKAMK